MTTKNPVHTEVIKVRWGDMDALNHVNNSVFFRYMEQARISWFDSIGVAMIANHQGPVVVSATCNFLKPIVYPATVAVGVFLGHVGRSSFVIHHEIISTEAALRYAEGETTIVWIDHKRVKSIAMPNELRQHFLTNKEK